MGVLSLFALLFSFVTASAAHADATAAPVQCVALFQANSGFWQKTKTYSRDVVASGGRRLVLKPFDDGPTPAQTRWLGLLTQQILNPGTKGVRKYWNNVVNFIPRKIGHLLARDNQFQFTPFAGIYNITMRKPVGYLSRKILGTHLEPAFFFKFPVTVALSVGIYMGVDAAYQVKLQNHIHAEVVTHSVEFDHAIQSDYRYNSIRLALEKGDITTEEAQNEAYLISLAYSQYFQYRDSQPNPPTLDSEMGLIDHYLFSYLKPVIENGVTTAQGYFVPTEAVGPLSEAQTMQLFQHAHLRYLKYQIVIEMLQNSDLFQKMKSNDKFLEVIKSIEDDAFAKTLFGFYQEERISGDQLQRYLQEDIYWQNRFQDWETLGVTRLTIENDQFTDKPLTLSDIRAEVLAEIARFQTLGSPP